MHPPAGPHGARRPALGRLRTSPSCTRTRTRPHPLEGSPHLWVRLPAPPQQPAVWIDKGLSPRLAAAAAAAVGGQAAGGQRVALLQPLAAEEHAQLRPRRNAGQPPHAALRHGGGRGGATRHCGLLRRAPRQGRAVPWGSCPCAPTPLLLARVGGSQAGARSTGGRPLAYQRMAEQARGGRRHTPGGRRPCRPGRRAPAPPSARTWPGAGGRLHRTPPGLLLLLWLPQPQQACRQNTVACSAGIQGHITAGRPAAARRRHALTRLPLPPQTPALPPCNISCSEPASWQELG